MLYVIPTRGYSSFISIVLKLCDHVFLTLKAVVFIGVTDSQPLVIDNPLNLQNRVSVDAFLLQLVPVPMQAPV